jgi:glycosyltransferase involved in cell wall biosynthesis
MRVLFLHAHFPGHYEHLAPALAADPRNRVVFATAAPDAVMAGVDVRTITPHRPPAGTIHPYLRPLEGAVLLGQAAFRLCLDLRAEGFVPDVVCAHAGFGPGLFVKEAFPDARMVTYFEWFYRARDSDADFLGGPVHPDDACRIHVANAALLLELAACDVALCPTAFQRSRFPQPLRDRMVELHDGIDTDRIRPAPGTPMVLPGLDLTGAQEIVTYATRGMEAYRGFAPFMRAAADLVERRPGLHVVVGGTDATFYGPRRADGRPWGAAMRDALAGRDLSRIHFVGPLAPESWLRLLQATSVHVYLTVPFVLSWSLIEAMAAGCCIVGSDTDPVREVIDDGRHGLLADMRDPADIARRIATALDDQALRARLGAAARARAVERYALSDLLARHVRLVAATAKPGRIQNASNFI